MDRGGHDWALFVDWCVAVGARALPASPSTVLAFFEDMPAGPRWPGAPGPWTQRTAWPGPGRPAGTLWTRWTGPVRTGTAADRGATPLARALRSAPIGGWPAGLVGRRDAAIVALMCTAGLSRDQVRRLRGLDVAWAAGRLNIGSSPGSCPRCALTRRYRAWLLVAVAGWRRARVRIEELGAALAQDTAEHDCSELAGLGLFTP